MKNLWIAGAALAACAAGAAIAQTRSAEDGEEIQRELEAKAVRIPARDLAAALRASDDGRSDRAEMLERGPDLEALRENLRRTRDEDSTRTADESAQQETRAARPSLRRPPPPGLRAASAQSLPNADRAEIERVFIPVLIPDHPDIRDKVKIYGMRNVYTATAIIDAQANLSMTGTCNRVIGGDPDVVAFRRRLAEGPPRLRGTQAEYHISRNDFGVDLSFSKFGCGYVMTIECGDPSADPRCTANDYITGLAETLILANPELAGGE